MALRRGNSETAKLQKVVQDLPKKVSTWTPEQRKTYTEQSDRAMREQVGRKPKKS